VRAERIGRALGIGLRVAGRVAGQRMADGARAGATAPPATQAVAVGGVRQLVARRAIEQLASGGVARGIGGFFRPFRRVGGILWLEITGSFFLLFALIFAQSLWRMRASFPHGPDHQKLLFAAAMTAVFFYLGVSSFWRARKR